MKPRILFVIACILLASGSLIAQEVLTNKTIIRMVKAKLSDELIIDALNSSVPNFNLSADSLKILQEANVSELVIKAMAMKSNVDYVSPSENKGIIVLNQQDVASNQEIEQTLVSESMKMEIKSDFLYPDYPEIKITFREYVKPIKLIVQYYNNEFERLSGMIHDWNKQHLDSIQKADEINSKIISLEQQLIEKQNAGTNEFSPDILALKSQLNDYRNRHKVLRTNMSNYGLKMNKNLTTYIETNSKILSSLYNSVSGSVKSFDNNPLEQSLPDSLTIAKKIIDTQVIYYISPLNQLLRWYQNQIVNINKLTDNWNHLIADKIVKINAVNENKNELKAKLKKYETEPKKYKTEISSTKKEIDACTKDIRKLTTDMKNESKQLSGSIEQTGKVVQSSLKERFNDILERINYSYQEKLNL